MYPFRVFVSYSHEDLGLVERVVDRLQKMKLHPIIDRNIRPGIPFSDQIKDDIAHAHLFLAVLTKTSVKRPWVHQETGYAMGMGVPVLPLAIGGQLPGQMLQDLQALRVRQDLSDLGRRIQEANLEHLVREATDRSSGAMECADLSEERTAGIVKHCLAWRRIGGEGRVRQKAALSSFCIPPEWSQKVWQVYDGDEPRSEYSHRLLRRERKELGRFAEASGCDLIVSPSLTLTHRGRASKIIRLEKLRDFLKSMQGKARVVIRDEPSGENLLIVGDWFVAESKSLRRGEGYRHTTFTYHAPTVLERLRRFDEEFQELLDEAGCDGESSRIEAIKRIEKEISKERRKTKA